MLQNLQPPIRTAKVDVSLHNFFFDEEYTSSGQELLASQEQVLSSIVLLYTIFHDDFCEKDTLFHLEPRFPLCAPCRHKNV